MADPMVTDAGRGIENSRHHLRAGASASAAPDKEPTRREDNIAAARTLAVSRIDVLKEQFNRLIKEEEREEVFKLVIAIYKATTRLDRDGDGGNDDINDNTPITKGDLKKAIVKAFT